MEYIWIYLSLLAGTLQTIRNATSKSLVTRLRPNGVTLVRFGYALPFTVLYIFVLLALGFRAGELNALVFVFAFLTALFQMIGNFLLVSLFQYKNFAVAVNFSRTDLAFATILGVLFFGQFVSVWGLAAIVITLVATFYANGYDGRFDAKTVAAGLSSGFAFATSSFTVRYTNTSYVGGDLFLNTGISLFLVLLIQTIILVSYHCIWEREQLKIILRNRRTDLIVGTSSAMGSICWFLALSLSHVAYVRTVGQIEVVWTLLASHLFFNERLKYNEWIGIILTVVGILILIFGQ